MKVLAWISVIVAAAGVTFLLLLPDPAPDVPTPPPLSDAVLERLPEERSGQVLVYGAYGFTGSRISGRASEYEYDLTPGPT